MRTFGTSLRAGAGWGAGLAVLLVAAGDILVYGHAAGVGVALFILLVALAILLRRPGCGADRHRRDVLSVVVILAGALVYDGGFAVLLAVPALVVLAVRTRNPVPWDLGYWLKTWARFFLVEWTRVFRDCGVAGAARRRRPVRKVDAAAIANRFLTGCLHWAVAGVLALFFILLFAVANPVFLRGLKAVAVHAADMLEQFLAAIRLSRILFWGVVGLWGYALLRFRPGRPAAIPVRLPRTGVETLGDRFLSPLFAARCLLLFNLVFALENGLDLYYLWGGAGLPEGVTHAQYAHRGAYLLVCTAILAAGFVLVMFRSGSRVAASRGARGLVFLWIAQNVLLTVSAGWRLLLYVGEFSLTRLRLAAGIWMGLVVAGLVLICARIVRDSGSRWLVNANAACLLGVLFLCAIPDLDGFIARYNVAHCREMTGTGRDLDIDYLVRLGTDAIPALCTLAESGTSPGVDARARKALDELAWELSGELESWQGHTIIRHRASAALDAL